MGGSSKPRRLRVALVGRPNVGKSSLFNRLLGRREAIVHDRPGVTRDRIERDWSLGNRRLVLEDTGGLVPDADEDLLRVVTRQAMHAAHGADLVLLLLDGRAGVTMLDEAVAELLRDAGARVVPVVNKVDVAGLESLTADAWRLGLGEPQPVSAEHARGIEDLRERILAELPPAEDLAEDEETADRRPDPLDELQLAIVGRPNVGKSSIVNRLLGEERISVSPVPGTTRDAVDVALTREGHRYRLIDTAGLRRRTRVTDRDEAVGIMLSRRRLERAHVAILVLDATDGPTSQDVAIAGEIVDAGRPFVIALNKWDLVDGPEEAVTRIDSALERRLQFARYAPRITVSALTGQRVFKLLDTARSVAIAASRRLRTSELNRFLSRTLGEHLAVGGSAPKVFYLTQTGVLPPRFVLFCRDERKVTPQMRRFLEGRLRDTFELGPTPVRVQFRSTPRRSREERGRRR